MTHMATDTSQDHLQSKRPPKGLNTWRFFLSLKTKKNSFRMRKVVIGMSHLNPEDGLMQLLRPGLSSETQTHSFPSWFLLEPKMFITSRWATRSLAPPRSLAQPLTHSLTHSAFLMLKVLYHSSPYSNSWVGVDDSGQPPWPPKSSIHLLTDLLHPLIHFHQQLPLRQASANHLKSQPTRT